MDMNLMLKQAKKMQADLDKKQKEFATKEFDVEKQGISLKINGNREITFLNIHPALIDPEDKETLEDLIMITINEAIELVEEQWEIINPSNKMGL